MFLSVYRQKSKEKKKQQEKKLAGDSIIWSWMWQWFQQWLRIAVVTASKLVPFWKFLFYRTKLPTVKNGKGSHGKDAFLTIPDFLKWWRRLCVCVCVHARVCACVCARVRTRMLPSMWREWWGGTDNGSELVLKLLKCEKHTIFLLSSSNLSLFLKSLQYCNKSENCLNKNKKKSSTW